MKKPILSFKNVYLALQGQTILEDVTLDIYPGDFILLLGSNGSGKSSLLKMMSGLLTPTSGEILFQGRNLAEIPVHKRAQEIAMLTQDPNLSTFSDLTLLENCLMAVQRKKKALPVWFSKKNLNQIVSTLNSYLPQLCGKLHEKIHVLSGGERQTVAFALSLWNTPQLLLLDEHTSALDPVMAQKLMSQTHHVVTEKKITTIVTTHQLDDALQYGDRIIAMKKGRVILDLGEKKDLNLEQLLTVY